MKLKRVPVERKGPRVERQSKQEELISKLTPGLCFHFHPQESNIYLVGTQEGHIHLCSSLNHEQYLETYQAHQVGAPHRDRETYQAHQVGAPHRDRETYQAHQVGAPHRDRETYQAHQVGAPHRDRMSHHSPGAPSEPPRLTTPGRSTPPGQRPHQLETYAGSPGTHRDRDPYQAPVGPTQRLPSPGPHVALLAAIAGARLLGPMLAFLSPPLPWLRSVAALPPHCPMVFFSPSPYPFPPRPCPPPSSPRHMLSPPPRPF
ncbi:hypothetical protein CRUP_012540, partial [Coryphaenoides rupestris]